MTTKDRLVALLVAREPPSVCCDSEASQKSLFGGEDGLQCDKSAVSRQDRSHVLQHPLDGCGGEMVEHAGDYDDVEGAVVDDNPVSCVGNKELSVWQVGTGRSGGIDIRLAVIYSEITVHPGCNCRAGRTFTAANVEEPFLTAEAEDSGEHLPSVFLGPDHALKRSIGERHAEKPLSSRCNIQLDTSTVLWLVLG